jgi:hypothetical protein
LDVFVLVRLIITSVAFVPLHGPGGQGIVLNVEEISSIREIVADDSTYHESIHCVIVMTNGKAIGIVETCIDALKLIEEAQ